MKVYISGPIDTDIPNTDKEERLSRFRRCEAWISKHKPEWEVVNPTLVEACDGEDLRCEESLDNIYVHSWECYLRHDLIAMLACEAIVFLPSYTESRGACLEAYVAQSLGMQQYLADDQGRITL